MTKNFERGDFVTIERECGTPRMNAMVVLASDNGDSLMLMFDGFFDGYAGSMPTLREGGQYRDLVKYEIVKIEAAR